MLKGPRMFRYTLTLVTIILLSNTVSLRVLEEPSCSKFDFEEKVLEKLIKLEVRVDNELQRFREDISKQASGLTELSDLVAEIQRGTGQMTSSLNAISDSVTELQQGSSKSSQMQTELMDAIRDTESKVSTHQTMLETIASQAGKAKDPVLFVVHTPPSTSLAQNKPVVYKTVVVNEGGGYSSTTGKFTAPKGGVYIFSAQICSGSSWYVKYQIMVNGSPYSSSFQYEDTTGVCAGVSTTALISQGDLVWVQIVNTGARVVNSASSYPVWNMFTGTLVH